MTAVNFGNFKLAFICWLSDSATEQERLYVKLSKPTIENAAGVVLAMIGILSVPATGGVTGYAKAGAALLLAYKKLVKDASAHGGEMSVVVKGVQTRLEADFDSWAVGGDIPAGAFAPADTAVAAVLPLLNPSPERLFACNRDNERFVALLLEDAKDRATHDFGPGSDPQIAHNCSMLAAVFWGALRALDGDADFERKIGAWFQREILANQNRQTAMLEELLRRTPDRSREISEKAIIALAQRISIDVDNIEGALVALDGVVEIVISEREVAAQGSNFGDQIDEVVRRISALTDEGMLDEASNVADDAIANWQQQQSEERAKGIRLLELGINQDILRRDAVAVASKIIQKSEIQARDFSVQFQTLRSECVHWLRRGKDDGFQFDLQVSALLSEKCLEFPATRLDRGAALLDLGVAYCELGRRTYNPSRLFAALECYRAAMNECTRQLAPFGWAAAQNNLGITLRILGEREGNWDLLEQAAEAFRQSLEVKTLTNAPVESAGTLINLGNTLLFMGVRGGDLSILTLAVEHYRAALTVLSSTSHPNEWATAQNNLGGALHQVGNSTGNATTLREALEALSNSQLVWNRKESPHRWASLQNNVGAILVKLGGIEQSIELVESGAAAYQLALEVQNRDIDPIVWAQTQSGLGGALGVIGSVYRDKKRVYAAIQALTFAMSVRTKELAPLDWAKSQSNLAGVYLEMYELTGDFEWLAKSLTAVDSAMEVFHSKGTQQYVEQTGEIRASILLKMDRLPPTSL